MALDHLRETPTLRLWRFRGIGTALVGRLEHPDIAPWRYSQFAVTFLYIPVWFGRFYAVRTSHMAGGLMVRGSMTGKEIVARYGRKAYWRLKLDVLMVPLIALTIFALLLGRSLWMRAHPPA